MATKTESGRQRRRSAAPKKKTATKKSAAKRETKDKGGLTPKQRLFVAEYLVDKNATQAAIRAGYSQKTAYSIGEENLKKPEIREAIDVALQQQVERVEVTADTVLRELLALATVDIAEAFNEQGALKPIHDIPKEVRKAISSIEVLVETAGSGDERQEMGSTKKLRFWDKKGALELLGKHLKMFTDKFEMTGKDGDPLNPTLTEFYARLGKTRDGQ